MMHVGDIMIDVVGYLEYRGGVQYCRGYNEYHGVYFEYCGDTQYHGRYHNADGVYHECRGGVQDHGGIQSCYLSTSTVQKTPAVLMISPTVRRLQKMMISPSVLSIPHGTQDIPSWYS